MDKFKIKILPDSKIIFNFVLNIIGMATIISIIIFISSCDDDVYIANYNKDFEEINGLVFEVDSLIMTIEKDLDSLRAKGY